MTVEEDSVVPGRDEADVRKRAEETLDPHPKPLISRCTWYTKHSRVN